jgi:hypothetical protein
VRAALGAVALALAVAGCGSGGGATTQAAPPRLPHALGQAWAKEAAAVRSTLAAGDTCTAKTHAIELQGEVVAAVNAHRIPRPLLEPLSSGVNDLVARITCVPPPAVTPGRSGEHGHGPGKKHGKGNGEGD